MGRRLSREALTGGGPDGNERLTSIVGAILIVLLAVLGITIVRIGQLIWLHLFLGLLLLGPVVAKMASTGYRFIRYYTRNPAYRRKGPPDLLMRTTAPIVVVSTVMVFVTGVVLLFTSPRHRDPLVTLHKVSFIVWGVFTGLHVLGHLPAMVRSLRAVRTDGELSWTAPGAAGRWISLSGALVGGAVLAVALIPQFGPWTAHAAFLHHHH